MPDIIQLLPDSVANQIAAGEVIQRPASVIKELVENAVDAHADEIRIYIRDAGRTLIQVVDNGIGMSATDARMSFERHATSKIRQADDLFTLHTMGFRGEALPSICAISQVELRSRQKGSPMGTRLVISGSKVESQEPDLCDEGTNIMVKNIFFNVPARRKFLKSDNVELGNIMREFERLALVNPGIKMSIDTGNKTLELRKGTFLQRIGDLWKGSLSQQLIPVEAATSEIKISGYITRPEFARRRNPLQYFLVNGRNMRHPYFHKAVINSFTGLIAPDTMPCYFINFEVDPAKIDVNIHPTKNEIKFEDEMLIWSVLSAAIKGSLGKHSAVPSIDFEAEALPVEPLNGQEVSKPSFDIPLDYNPFADSIEPSQPSSPKAENSACISGGGAVYSPKSSTAPRDWESLYNGFMNSGPQERTKEVGMDLMPEITPDLCLQYASKYIVTCVGEGLLIIDQHRAHVKILYSRFMARFGSDESVSQTLLFPEPLELEPSQEAALAESRGLLKDLGMVIETMGSEHSIAGIPPMMEGISPAEVVVKVLDAVNEGSETYGSESPEEVAESLKGKVALTMARSMAVKRGRQLSPEEMERIVAELLSLPDPAVTPTGRRIYTVLDQPSIERLLP